MIGSIDKNEKLVKWPIEMKNCTDFKLLHRYCGKKSIVTCLLYILIIFKYLILLAQKYKRVKSSLLIINLESLILERSS